MTNTFRGERGQYEQPELRVVGAVALLTEQNKNYGSTDGFFFQGSAITNVS